MSFLFDSDIVANALKGRQRETALLQELSTEDLFISIMTYGEIYEGIYFGRDSQNNENNFQQFLRTVEILPLTELVMQRFALIRGQLRQAGNRLADNDLLIGATALQNNLTLITNNIKHFQRIPGLVLY